MYLETVQQTKKVKLPLCISNWALCREDVWGGGYIDPHILDRGISWRREGVTDQNKWIMSDTKMIFIWSKKIRFYMYISYYWFWWDNFTVLTKLQLKHRYSNQDSTKRGCQAQHWNIWVWYLCLMQRRKSSVCFDVVLWMWHTVVCWMVMVS
jgi:hypothetical protein